MSAAEQYVTHTLSPPRAARLAVTTIFFVDGALNANWFARVPDVKQLRGALGILAIFGVIIMLLGTHVKGEALAPAQAAVAEA